MIDIFDIDSYVRQIKRSQQPVTAEEMKYLKHARLELMTMTHEPEADTVLDEIDTLLAEQSCTETRVKVRQNYQRRWAGQRQC